jgi:sulfotransferase
MHFNFVGITGLPRAGSTLLGQLLAQHPEVHCEGNSSPLCSTLQGIRRQVSHEPFFLSQLDGDFDTAYGHLESAMQGFLRGWYRDVKKPMVVDKSRAWLNSVETLLALAPEAKLIICLRELGQVYGSVEARHQKTPLLDFVDQLADLDRFGRADALFTKERVIGAPLASLQSVGDLPPAVRQRLFFLRFEDLMANPVACMSHLFAWLGVAPYAIDPENLPIGAPESDSHYRMKYMHRQSGRISSPRQHEIPPRIQAQIEKACAWYYERYYPGFSAVAQPERP